MRHSLLHRYSYQVWVSPRYFSVWKMLLRCSLSVSSWIKKILRSKKQRIFFFHFWSWAISNSLRGERQTESSRHPWCPFRHFVTKHCPVPWRIFLFYNYAPWRKLISWLSLYNCMVLWSAHCVQEWKGVRWRNYFPTNEWVCYIGDFSQENKVGNPQGERNSKLN